MTNETKTAPNMERPACKYCGGPFHDFTSGLCAQSIDALWDVLKVDDEETEALDQLGVPFSGVAE